MWCSHHHWLTQKGKQGWGGCEEAVRMGHRGSCVPVPSREGWARPFWVSLSPSVDKTRMTTPAILLHTVKFFITFFGQESRLFFMKFQIIVHAQTYTKPSNGRCFCFMCHLLLSTSGMVFKEKLGECHRLEALQAATSCLSSFPWLKDSTWWHLTKLTFASKRFPDSAWEDRTHFCFGENSLEPHSRILWKISEVTLVQNLCSR